MTILPAIDYKISIIKTNFLLLKGLVETRKKIEELKKEGNLILEDTLEKLDKKSLEITKNYLKNFQKKVN